MKNKIMEADTSSVRTYGISSTRSIEAGGHLQKMMNILLQR
nr:hypothetical protein [Faecalicatena contorta]